MSGSTHDLSLDQVLTVLRQHSATVGYLKRLAPNDNSKNQVYLGPGFEALNLLPAGSIVADKSSHGNTFKASVDLFWLGEDGFAHRAPNAQMILYPQYPEVRMSGFLRGCSDSPNDVMTSREEGRVLVLGVSPGGNVFAYAAGADSRLASDVAGLDLPKIGIFEQLQVEPDSRARLLARLKEVHERGWIDSMKLTPSGPVPYEARNGGGYTLEACLGILPNGRGEPDFDGWEVKQHGVTCLDRADVGVLTLMTPEPSSGYYSDAGVESFLRKYGYPDKAGAVGRTNFGGVHRVGVPTALTGLTLELDGYDPASGLVTDVDGAVNLVAPDGEIAAGWPFDHMLSLWTRKHAQAVYVASMVRDAPSRQYCYGPKVQLGVGTDFLHFLAALAVGVVYYDPGIKMVEAAGRVLTKRRSQWRVKAKHVPALYDHVEIVDLTTL